MAEELEFLQSEKGNPILLVANYLYYINRKNAAEEKTYWKCAKYAEFRCRAGVITKDDRIEKLRGVHNHIADVAEIEAKKIICSVRQCANFIKDTPENILSAVSAGVSDAILESPHLPKTSSLKRTINNIRKRQGHFKAEIAIPQTKEEMLIPDDFQQTNEGEQFLMYDSGATEDRMLIYSTAQNLQLLSESPYWFGDGAFKMTAHLFDQLYVFHGIVADTTIPLVYALLPNKSEATYMKLLQQLKLYQANLSPAFILTDFEPTMMAAIRQEFPLTRHCGSFFDFAQNIYRRIEEEDLHSKYMQDAEFALQLRLLLALAFVPVEDVIESFELLAISMPLEVQSLMDHFEDTWIGRPQAKLLGRRPARVPINMWNCYDTVSNGVPYNALEGWHQDFEAQLISNQSSIWKFLHVIKKEQSLRRKQIQPYLTGEASITGTQRKKYKICATRLQNIVRKYNRNDKFDFLRSVAKNISF